MINYTISEEQFKKTFGIGEKSRSLTHHTGVRIRVFPFTTHKFDSIDINDVTGEYLKCFSKELPVPVSADELMEMLVGDNPELSIDQKDRSKLRDILKDVYFEEQDDRFILKPRNIELMSMVNADAKIKDIARYLSSLGDTAEIVFCVDKARQNNEDSGNVLDQYVVRSLKHQANTERALSPYYKVTKVFDDCFTKDITYILKQPNVSKDDLNELLGLYYVNSIIQIALQLDDMFDGSRTSLKPVYYSVEAEKVNGNRPCCTQGWRYALTRIQKIFGHAVTLELLNQTGDDVTERFDYIRLNELINDGSISDDEVATQIRRITSLYKANIAEEHIFDSVEYSYGCCKAEREARYLLDCVIRQFEGTVRGAAYNKYSQNFSEGYKDYLYNRGRLGNTLAITEDRLIFLTKLCIKDEAKLRLNEVFTEFQKRGIYLDAVSKQFITDFYEKLNLIEKKSDSGDAQYVKRIL